MCRSCHAVSHSSNTARGTASAEGLLEGVDLAGTVSVDELLSPLTDAGA